MTDDTPTVEQRREAAFERLVQLIREWREHGRKTTTAGVKPALLQADPGFDVAALGYRDFRSFTDAAVQAGRISMHRMSSGHWFLLLPGEDPPLETNPSPPSDVAAAGSAGSTVRLKSDVWTCFVDWNENYRRMWDRDERRAFMYPTDSAGEPAWTGGQSQRFERIEPATQQVQLDWMRQFVERQDSEDREALSSALNEQAPRGAFRRALEERGLQGAWRQELQARVADHAIAWAEERGIAAAAMTDTRVRTSAAVAASPGKPEDTRRLAGPLGVRGTPPAAGSAREGDELERLRARLHRIIDKMTLSELAAIPVRAEHLLD